MKYLQMILFSLLSVGVDAANFQVYEVTATDDSVKPVQEAARVVVPDLKRLFKVSGSVATFAGHGNDSAGNPSVVIVEVTGE